MTKYQIIGEQQSEEWNMKNKHRTVATILSKNSRTNEYQLLILFVSDKLYTT